jgi:hypothetical protein
MKDAAKITIIIETAVISILKNVPPAMPRQQGDGHRRDRA